MYAHHMKNNLSCSIQGFYLHVHHTKNNLSNLLMLHIRLVHAFLTQSSYYQGGYGHLQHVLPGWLWTLTACKNTLLMVGEES